jgi:hypothetical protein
MRDLDRGGSLGRAHSEAQDSWRGKRGCKDVATRVHVNPPWAMLGAISRNLPDGAKELRHPNPSFPPMDVIEKSETSRRILVRCKLWQNCWSRLNISNFRKIEQAPTAKGVSQRKTFFNAA